MNVFPSLVLPPLSAAYRAMMHARLALYRRGTLPVYRLAAPVISVGNVTTGGTGKTPLVERICYLLTLEGKKVCVLTRGYGRENPKMRVVVSDGTEILATEREAGDEPFLLAQNLKGLAAVVSDADRFSAGEWAMSELGADAFVLDDGFQHLRLARELDIVAVDATNPWSGNHLLPYGRLREPVSGLSRADCIVITRCEQSDDTRILENEIGRLSRNRPTFLSQMKTKTVRAMTGTVMTSPNRSGPIGAFCAVGNPQSFFKHLRRDGFQLVFTRAFPDHHVYSQADISELVRDAKKQGATKMLTTAKDAVKLQSFDLEIECQVLEIEVSIDHEERFIALLQNAISKP